MVRPINYYWGENTIEGYYQLLETIGSVNNPIKRFNELSRRGFLQRNTNKNSYEARLRRLNPGSDQPFSMDCAIAAAALALTLGNEVRLFSDTDANHAAFMIGRHRYEWNTRILASDGISMTNDKKYFVKEYFDLGDFLNSIRTIKEPFKDSEG